MNLSHPLMDGATDGTGGGGTGGGGTGAPADGGTGSVNSGAPADGSTSGTNNGLAPAWYEKDLANPEDRTWIANKKWSGLQDVVTGARNAEKLIGADPKSIIRMPRADDAAGQTAMWRQLGMPEKPDGYDLGKTPDGMKEDPTWQSAVKGMFHKANLTAEQAKVVSAAYNEYAVAQAQQANIEYNQKVQQDEQALRNEWKGGYDAQMNRAKQTAHMLGFTADAVDGLESKLGYAGTIKLLAGLAAKFSEDTFVSAEGTRTMGAAMTPEEAKNEWQSLAADEKYRAALFDKDHPGHAKAKQQQTRLFQIMHPE